MRITHAALGAALMAAPLAAPPAYAQDVEAPPSLTLELNALTASETGCRVTFLATNRLGAELVRSTFEIALFGAGGGIARLVSLEFKAMPDRKTRVLQFDIGDVECDSVTRVLINDILACEGADLDPRTCFERLTTASRIDSVEFGV